MMDFGKGIPCTSSRALRRIFSLNAIRDYPNLPQFYSELLQWLSDFQELSASEKDWVHVIWNNKDIRIGKKPIFYQNYYESGIIYL